MTTPLVQDLFNSMQGRPAAELGESLGMSPAQAESAISAALPLLVGALGRNAGHAQGVESLLGALQRDHAGGDLEGVLGTVLGGGGQGAAILGHMLGGQQRNAARGLGAATGLNNDRAGMLLRMLAPIVMAYLARRVFSPDPAPAGTRALTPHSLGGVLEEEGREMRRTEGVQGGLLRAVLDQDGDGDMDLDDLLRLGGSIFGGGR